MGQVQVEWTKVPRKMCASGGVRAAHMSAAGQQRESTGLGGCTGRAGTELSLLQRSGSCWDALPRLPWAIACPLQAAPRGWLPASLVPIGFFSYELAPTPMGCGFPLHPCVGFGYVNSLSYRNQAALPCFRCTPRVFSESSSLVGPVIHHLNLCTRF